MLSGYLPHLGNAIVGADDERIQVTRQHAPCVFKGFTGNDLQVVRAVGDRLSPQAKGPDGKRAARSSRRRTKVDADDFAEYRRPPNSATAGKSDGAVDQATKVGCSQICKRKQVFDHLQRLPPQSGTLK